MSINMFVRRSTTTLIRQSRAVRPAVGPAVRRPLFMSAVRRDEKKKEDDESEEVIDLFNQGGHRYKRLEEIRGPEDLLPPGAKPGEVPSDLENATGAERLEILGKMEGIDIFDMRPLDSSRVGTMEDPIMVNSAGDEQYAGCTGCPADSHTVLWLTMSRKRPIERCTECGSVYKMNYIGPEDDEHAHHPDPNDDPDFIPYEEPKDFSDYVRPEYYYK